MVDVNRFRLFASRRLVLVFGVCLATLTVPFAAIDDTSAQDEPSGAWTLLGVGDGPAARWDHTLAANESGGRLLLFGGRDGNGDAFGDTWIFDTEDMSWHEVTGAGPAARFGQAVAVDQDARLLYLFGGQAASTFYDDAWRFDFTTETWQQLDIAVGPAARYGHSAVLDGDGRLLISHGFTFEGRFDDTWALDLASGEWVDVSPVAGGVRPLRRCLHEAVWETERGRMLLFGGCASGFGPCPLGDLWAFDPAERVWTELTPDVGPAARTNPALVVDSAGQRAILLAGSTAAGYTFDAWTIDLAENGATWTELSLGGEAPSARSSLDAVVLNGGLYLFGGIGEAGVSAELWTVAIESI